MSLIPSQIFENEDLLVLNKPAGLTVNRSQTTKNQVTLQDWLNQQKVFAKVMDKTSDFYQRSGIVHRLDKETSGVILIAKNPQTFSYLQKQFKDRLVKKVYLALVWGQLLNKGSINAPISRNPFNRFKFGVFLGGRQAQTEYKVLKNGLVDGCAVSLLEVYPLTGRTHQIRVHLHYLGYPVVGDSIYGGRKLSRQGLKIFGRLMLHAFKISCRLPKTGEEKEFVAPIPAEFQKIP